MHSIGLTGGIGSGKSTVARMLQELGAVLIDADEISRRCTQAGGAAIPAIRQTFGNEFITDDHALKRAAMRALITREPLARMKLEAIIHPIVREQIAIEREKAQRSGAKLTVIEIPLLAEGGGRWRSQLDAVWVVDCSPETQLMRVQARSGWPRAQIEAIMAAQASRMQRLTIADAVIFNDGKSLEEIHSEITQLAQSLL